MSAESNNNANVKLKQNKNLKNSKNNTKQAKNTGNADYRKGKTANSANMKIQNNNRSKMHHKTVAQRTVQKPPIKIAFLGGLNEIGKNLTVIECEDDMIIIDCGVP